MTVVNICHKVQSGLRVVQRLLIDPRLHKRCGIFQIINILERPMQCSVQSFIIYLYHHLQIITQYYLSMHQYHWPQGWRLFSLLQCHQCVPLHHPPIFQNQESYQHILIVNLPPSPMHPCILQNYMNLINKYPALFKVVAYRSKNSWNKRARAKEQSNLPYCKIVHETEEFLIYSWTPLSFYEVVRLNSITWRLLKLQPTNEMHYCPGKILFASETFLMHCWHTSLMSWRRRLTAPWQVCSKVVTF